MCAFTGTVSATSIDLHLDTARSDRVCYLREFVCQGSRYREEAVADQSNVTGTVSASNMTLQGQTTTRIFHSGSNDQIGEHRSSCVTDLTKQ